ncbi:MAG: tetratricopeptide repeat protein [Prolixibacteraceae bacterium]|nr:tetratricopeptide repeat protein [Prolixibacteraceae bacterium]
MERSKHIHITLLLILAFSLAQGSARNSIYQAFITNNMHRWKLTIDSMEQKPGKTDEQLLELINYQYGYIAWCIGNKRLNEARLYLDKAFSNLRRLEKDKQHASRLSTYLAAFYGFEIGLAQYKAPYYGLKSIDAAKKALALDENSWMAYIQSANIQYYMPSIFGGSKTEALHLYEKALNLLENDNNNIDKNWNYLNLMVQLGEGYTMLGDYDKAATYYEKIISIEPGFSWVKDELYPGLIKQKNSK